MAISMCSTSLCLHTKILKLFESYHKTVWLSLENKMSSRPTTFFYYNCYRKNTFCCCSSCYFDFSLHLSYFKEAAFIIQRFLTLTTSGCWEMTPRWELDTSRGKDQTSVLVVFCSKRWRRGIGKCWDTGSTSSPESFLNETAAILLATQDPILLLSSIPLLCFIPWAPETRQACYKPHYSEASLQQQK